MKYKERRSMTYEEVMQDIESRDPNIIYQNMVKMYLANEENGEYRNNVDRRIKHLKQINEYYRKEVKPYNERQDKKQ